MAGSAYNEATTATARLATCQRERRIADTDIRLSLKWMLKAANAAKILVGSLG
jgi:hypothetical protein